MMIIDYLALQNFFLDVFNAANSASSPFDLSAGLDKRVALIAQFDPTVVAINKGQYPFITVNFKDKNEEPLEIATQNFNRRVTINAEFMCGYDALANSEVNLYKLVDNLETNLRYNKDIVNYHTLGLQVRYSLPYQTVFKRTFGPDGSAFNKTALVKYRLVCDLKNY